MNVRNLLPTGLLGAAALFAGCASNTMPLPNLEGTRPVVSLVVAPSKGDSTSYLVHFEWSGTDADGQVTGYEYALDPPAMPGPGHDTTWVATTQTTVDLVVSATRPVEPLPPPGNPANSSDYHTVVVRAVDNHDLRSAPVSRSFTAYTVAPQTLILFPRPNSQFAVGTPEAFRVTWAGTDPDGTGGPVRYKLRLATNAEVTGDPLLPATAAQVQAFFGADAPGFATAGWDSVPGDSTGRSLTGLSAGVSYYFAVVAIDASGAYEPRFSQDSNVLRFRPTLDVLGPRITVWNETFYRTQLVGGVSLDPSRIYPIAHPVGRPLTFNWTAQPPQGGSLITGYRWALDIEDILDETPRSGPDDLGHWSPWSLDVTSITLGPFTEGPAHFFYLEARDGFGYLSLFTVRIDVVGGTLDRPLLLVDDLYGTPTQLVNAQDPGGPVRINGPYPMEAEQDSFYVARGGFPDSLSIRSGTPGVFSLRGVFADYEPDTLDYRFYPNDGIVLSDLSRYKAVAWYTDTPSAARSGAKFGSVSPSTALRAINSANRQNTLAVYLSLGGKVWLFGEGATTAIANGYYASRYHVVPPLPYTSGEDPRNNVLVPGNFLYDFCHLRSELTAAGPNSPPTELVGCTPFLPAYRPLEPGAARTAERWPDLPRLIMAAYRGSTVSPGLSRTFLVHKPNVIEDLDTLYTYEARTPDPDHVYAPYDVDGYPNAIHYYGADNGAGSQLVWFGFPLHYFEREQVRTVVQAVMRNFGIEPAPGARTSGRARTRT